MANIKVQQIDQWLDKFRDPSNRKKGALPYRRKDDRKETSDDITWSMAFSGGFGDGRYIREVTYDKITGWFETGGIYGWGYTNMADIFKEFKGKMKKQNNLPICNETLSNYMKKHDVIYAEEKVSEGKTIYETFSLKSKNPIYCFMAAIGIQKIDNLN